MKNAANMAQFASPVMEETYSEAGKREVLVNTTQCSSWALQTFQAWAAERNNHVPCGILHTGVVCKYASSKDSEPDDLKPL